MMVRRSKGWFVFDMTIGPKVARSVRLLCGREDAAIEKADQIPLKFFNIVCMRIRTTAEAGVDAF